MGTSISVSHHVIILCACVYRGFYETFSFGCPVWLPSLGVVAFARSHSSHININNNYDCV